MHRIWVRISSGFRLTAGLVLVLLAAGQACAQRDPRHRGTTLPRNKPSSGSLRIRPTNTAPVMLS